MPKLRRNENGGLRIPTTYVGILSKGVKGRARIACVNDPALCAWLRERVGAAAESFNDTSLSYGIKAPPERGSLNGIGRSGKPFWGGFSREYYEQLRPAA